MTNQVAKLDETTDFILKNVRDQITILRFKKGAYLIRDEEVPEGTEYLSYPYDVQHGYQKWQNKKLIEARMARYLPPDNQSFNPDQFPEDDGWTRCFLLPLEDLRTGEVIGFQTSSAGGRRAINTLCRQTADRVKKGIGDQTPIVRLVVGTFTSKEFGEHAMPVLQIADNAEAAEAVETAKAVKPDSFNDEIPF